MKQRPRPGGVFSVNLGDGFYGFGLVVNSSETIFLRLFSDDPNQDPLAVIASGILCRLIVNRSAFRSDRWQVLGKVSIPVEWQASGRYWNRSVGSEDVWILDDGGMTPASVLEVKGMEQAAAWFDLHVEERLRASRVGQISKHELWSRDPDQAPWLS